MIGRSGARYNFLGHKNYENFFATATAVFFLNKTFFAK